MTDFSGNQPGDWYSPSGQIAPGAMTHMIVGSSICAGVARDPGELVNYIPASTFFVTWCGDVEAFQTGVARLVTHELFVFLAATEAQNSPRADVGPPSAIPDTVTVTPLVDFEVNWAASTDVPAGLSLEDRIARLESPAARQAEAQAAEVARHHPPAHRVIRFRKGVPQAVAPALAAFLKATGHPVK